MGGQQSSRRVAFENEQSNNVIKVSEKVVERLKGSVEENAKSSPASNPPRSYNTVQVQPETPPPVPASPDPAIYQVGPPVTTTTALDIKRQYEDELKKTDEYWQNRIKDIEKSNERINQIWHNEYKKAIEEAESNPMIPLRGQDPLPCGDKKSVVINCYMKHPNQPLKCANEVKAFSDCVHSAKINKV